MSATEMANDEIGMTNEIRNPSCDSAHPKRYPSPCELRHSSLFRHSGFVIPLLLCVTVSLGFDSALAAPSIERVDLGFDGNYKLGYWTPLSVKLGGLPDSKNLSLEVIVPDSDGVPTRVRHPLADSKALSAELFVKIGRNTGEMLVVLRNGEREVARRALDLAGGELAPALPSDAWLLVTLGTTKHLAETLAANRQFRAAGGRIVGGSGLR